MLNIKHTFRPFVLLSMFAFTLSILWLLTAIANPVTADENVAIDYATDRVILAFRSSRQKSPSFSQQVIQLEPLSPEGNMGRESSNETIYIAHLADGISVEKAVEDFSADPTILWVEPDYLAYSATQPDDPLLPQQWALHQIGITESWNIVTGTPSTIIAVLDSGISFTHPDFASKLWTNPGEIPNNGVDDDNNGLIDDINGWDFVSEDNDPVDYNGHGTQVAGVAAAATNNGTGIAGACPECRIMPVQVMQISGFANYSDITQGVLYAARKGADVINISLGGYQNSTALRNAIETAVSQYGAVVVAGAGNDNKSQLFYPAAYTNVVAVGGTTITDMKTNFSNYGEWVDVVAPASDLTTTFLGDDYGLVSGTSYAAPLVAGLAGLIRTQHPDWPPALVVNQIKRLATPIDDINPSYAGQLGSGRVDAYASVATEPQPVLSVAEFYVDNVAAGRLVAGETHTLDIDLYNDWLSTSGITATLTAADPLLTINTDLTTFEAIPSGAVIQSSAPFSLTVDAAAGFSYPISLTLHLTSADSTYTTTQVVTLQTRTPNEPVSGAIFTDTVWTNDKTYFLTANVGVAPDFTLTIEPGTVVHMADGYTLDIGGTLIARGTPQEPIRFILDTGYSPLFFASPSKDAVYDEEYNYLSGSIIEHAMFEGTGLLITCQGGRPYLSHVTVEGSVNCNQTTPAAFEGPLVVKNSQIGNSLKVPGSVILLDSIVSQSISGADQDSSLIHNSTASSAGSLGNDSIIRASSLRSVSMGNGGLIEQSSVNGDLEVRGAGWVYSNTVTAGGVIVGDGSIVRGNTIQDTQVDFAALPGLYSDGAITAINNRVVNAEMGIYVNGGTIQGNLVVGSGISIGGDATVISNTIMESPQNGLYLRGGTQFEISGNNFIRNAGYAVRTNTSIGTIPTILAQHNWWETTSSSEINGKIWDANDDYNKSRIVYSPVLTMPAQFAPAYVTDMTILPENVIGIEEMTVDVTYSRPMNINEIPSMDFSSQASQWQEFNTGYGNIHSVAIDNNGNLLAGVDGGVATYDGSSWSVVATGTAQEIREIYVIGADQWWAVGTSSIFEYRGGIVNEWTWEEYGASNSSEYVRKITRAPNGVVWALSGATLFSYSGGSWTKHVHSSGFALAAFNLAVDQQNRVWIVDTGGLLSFYGGEWESHGGYVGSGIAVASDGTVWVTAEDSQHQLASFDGSDWNYLKVELDEDYGTPRIVTIGTGAGDELYLGTSYGLVIYKDGVQAHYPLPFEPMWFSHVAVHGQQVAVRLPELVGFTMTLPQTFSMSEQTEWLSDNSFRASYNVTSLVPRDIYTVSVEEGVDSADMLTVPQNGLTFTVAYAAGIANETTPPLTPIVTLGHTPETSSIAVSWSAYDPDTPVDKYRYALGERLGSADVLNWTTTTQSSMTRDSLQLTDGTRYYFSVQARNAGGLYSPIGTATFVAGQTQVPTAISLVSQAVGGNLVWLPTLSLGVLSFLLIARFYRKRD